MSVVGSPGSPVVLMTVVLNVQVRCEGSQCEVPFEVSLVSCRV